jgi:glycosyltransferase involved in cell wall biosynthesis
VVIPARNEAANLPGVLDELRRARPHDDCVVVDDCSGDATAAAARTARVAVLRLPLHLGYGGAVQAGIKLGLRRGYAVVATLDGDGQHDPADLAPLVEAVTQGADIAIGSRYLASASHHGSLTRHAGRRLFSVLTRALTGWPITDPTSGLKALGPRGQRLFARSRFPDRFPDADALVIARRARLLVTERPARMRASRNRHSMHGGGRAVAYTFNMLLSLLAAAAGSEADLGG